jgi:hypothetical protein
MSRATFTIEEVDTRQSSRGPFKRAKLSGIGWVTVFAEGDQDFLEENLGRPASAEIVTNDKGFKNASAFQKSDVLPVLPAGASPGPPQAAGGDRMSKEDWRKKDDMQHIRALAASHRADMISFYSAYPGAWEVSGIESYNDLWMRARKNAIKDLDWLRNYATSDVPFG